jgi:eukaryotic-like serine/threonine-protein kinase
MENKQRPVQNNTGKRPLGRILLDAIAEAILSSILFVFNFLVWTVRWSFMTLFFIAVMGMVAYYVFNEAVQGGNLVTVPDVAGMSITQAADIVTQAGLALGTQRQVVNEQVPEYHVILQRPTPNTVVRAGRKINLTISQGREFVLAPSLIGKQLGSVLGELENLRFLNGSIARMYNDAPRDNILAQDPAASAEVTIGTEIHLLVSDGPKARETIMPELIELPLEKAQLILADLNVVAVPYKINRPGSEYEVVLGQHPPAGTLLNAGQEVTYDVRLRPTSFLPNARRKVTISFIVPFASNEVEVRVESLDEAGKRSVIYPQISSYIGNQPPKVLPGSTITFSDLAYTNETTFEFYVDRKLSQSYFYSGDNRPIITNHLDTLLDNNPLEISPF